MSTFKKLAGKQGSDMRDSRKAALKFYREKTRLPGIAGAVAAEIYSTLLAIHRDPALNSPEKEHEFRDVIRRFAKPGRVDGDDTGDAAAPDAGADMAGLPAGESVPPAEG